MVRKTDTLPPKGAPKALDRRREIVLRTMLIAFGLAISLLLVEMTLRVIDYDLNANPRWHYHPDFGWTVSPAWKTVAPVVAPGFRFHEVPRAKPEGRKRLLVLGDSFALGSAYKYGQTFPGLLDTWLGDDWDVINLGVGGWGTAQQLLALREIGLRYDPDVVLLQVFPFNDLCNNGAELVFTCSLMDVHRPYLRPAPDGSLRPSPPVSLRTRARLRGWSRLAGLLELRFAYGQFAVGRTDSDPKAYSQWRKERRSRALAEAGLEGGSGAYYSLVPDALQPPSVQAAWQTTKALIETIASEVHERGIPLVSVVIPSIDTFAPAWAKLRKTRLPNMVAHHGTRTVETILERASVPTISLRAQIEANRQTRPRQGLKPADWFYPLANENDTHLNRLGHYNTARFVLWKLRQFNVTTQRPPRHTIDFDALHPTPTRVAIRGLVGPLDGKRPSRGRRTSLVFDSAGGESMEIAFDLLRHADHEIHVYINGEEQMRALVESPTRVREAFAFVSRRGRNVVGFNYPTFPPNRQGAAVFSKLTLRATALQEPSP